MADHNARRWTPQYLKLLAGMRALEVRSAVHDTLKRPRPDARHVLIYAQGRTGTTLLESLLASTGHFVGLGEPLHHYTREVWSPLRHVRGMGRAASSNVVAHVKGSQLVRERRRPVDPCTFLRAMHDDGWTIVHVRRLGLFEQVLSECVALDRGAYHKSDDRAEDLRLQITPKDFVKRLERRLKYREQDREALEQVPYLDVVYEDDLRDAARHQHTADRICIELGLPTSPVTTQLRRIGGTDPRDWLENYDEIVAALALRGLDQFSTLERT